MSNPMFSIVVPVYKVEQYLHECIDGVLIQQYKDYELILVEDGSPDGCPLICDEYSMKYPNIKVDHKKNGGLSSARNTGVAMASGKYIIFIDSDDYWYSPDLLSKIAEKAQEDSQVIIWGCTDYSSLTGKCIELHPRVTQKMLKRANSKKEALNRIFKRDAFPGGAVIVAVQRQLIEKNHIKFIEGLKAEDIDWLLNVFLSAESFAVIDNCGYMYRKFRGGSITNTADSKSFRDLMFTIKKWVYHSFEDETLKSNVYGLLSKHYLCALLIAADLRRAEYRECIKDVKAYKHLMKYNQSAAIRVARFLPVGILLRVLKKYRAGRRF